MTQRFGLQHFQVTPGAHGGQNIWQKMATRLKRGGGSSSQSSEELPQQCSSERLRRTPQQVRRDESCGAKDVQRGARRGGRGENAVARRCDGAAAPPPRRRCHFGGAQAGRQIRTWSFWQKARDDYELKFRVCQMFCVSDFCEGGFGFAYIQNESSFARTAILLGRTERSSPNAA